MIRKLPVALSLACALAFSVHASETLACEGHGKEHKKEGHACQCPAGVEGSSFKVENTASGARITITHTDAAKAKEIQARADKVGKGEHHKDGHHKGEKHHGPGTVEGAKVTFEKTEGGVVLVAAHTDAAKIKEIQDRAAKMAEHHGKGAKDGGGCGH